MSRRRYFALAAWTVGLFLALLIPWAIFYGATTDGGECSYEEVDCSRLGEFVDSSAFAALSLPLLAAVSVAIAWFLTARAGPRG